MMRSQVHSVHASLSCTGVYRTLKEHCSSAYAERSDTIHLYYPHRYIDANKTYEVMIPQEHLEVWLQQQQQL